MKENTNCFEFSYCHRFQLQCILLRHWLQLTYSSWQCIISFKNLKLTWYKNEYDFMLKTSNKVLKGSIKQSRAHALICPFRDPFPSNINHARSWSIGLKKSSFCQQRQRKFAKSLVERKKFKEFSRLKLAFGATYRVRLWNLVNICQYLKANYIADGLWAILSQK